MLGQDATKTRFGDQFGITGGEANVVPPTVNLFVEDYFVVFHERYGIKISAGLRRGKFAQ